MLSTQAPICKVLAYFPGAEECGSTTESNWDYYWLFWFGWSAWLTVTAYLFAELLWPNIGMPLTARIEWNFGVDGLRLQSSNFMIFHQKLFNHLTHLTIPYDVVCWLLLLRHFAGLEALFLAVAVLAYQASTFKERPTFTLGMLCMWAAILGSSLEIYNVCGQQIVRYAWITLPANALVRTIGHTVEYIPPLVSGRDCWVPPFHLYTYASFFRLSLVWWGFLAEMVAGLPYRVFVPQMFFAAQYFLHYNPISGPSIETANRITYKFYQTKWTLATADKVVKEHLLDASNYVEAKKGY
jgi:hypothetical protein